MDAITIKIAVLDAMKELAQDAENNAERHKNYGYGDATENKALSAASAELKNYILTLAEDSMSFNNIVDAVTTALKKGGESEC